MEIRLFGGVGAVGDLGEPLDVGPAKCQAVLAALALSPGSAVPVSRLVDVVWGEEPPRTAERTLQSYVTRLRKALGGDAIARTGSAYRLDLAAEAVDVVRFEHRLDAGNIEAALAEWTGTPLAGLDAPGLGGTVEALTERWLGAVERDLERRLEDDPPVVIGALTELTARHPFREGFWALLMTALYRVGRQADALAAYRTARAQLVEQLGVEPGPRLRELEGMILGQDELLAPRAGDAAAAHPAGGDRRGNLPVRLDRLIGREHELAVVAGTLASAAVVTLVGPGGIGKTRLALEAARAADAPDGAWLVELGEIAESSDVPRAVAETLGVKEGPGRTLAQSTAAALQSRRALVVLDNCEHVLEGAAELAEAIAAACPDVHVLATSREALGVRGEQVLDVEPLAPEGSAAELFDERAGAASRVFDARASRAEVEEICRRLDGVPLAIELAAARMRSLSPADLLARLDDRLRLLTGGRRTAAERQRTLWATIQWSYDLLTPGEQALFRRLSVFTGPFGLAAAETVAGGDDLDDVDVDRLLGDLVDRSMVMVAAGPFGRRFRLLETVRQFAAEHLDEGSRGDLARRHARWCAELTQSIGELLAGHGEIEGVARLQELWPNLRAALHWACDRGDADLALALVRPVAPEVLLRSRQEIGDWLERILALDPGDVAAVVFGLAWAARRYALSQDRDAYERLVDRCGEPDDIVVRHARAFVYEDYAARAELAPRAVAELRRRGERRLAELVDIDVGASLLNLGRFEECDAHLAALADRHRADGPPTCLNWSLMLLGYSAMLRGQHDGADRYFEEAIAVDVPPRTYSPNRPIEARTAFRRGERARAFRILRDHVDELIDAGNMHAASIDCVEFVNMTAALGRLDDAAYMLGYLETTGLLDAPAWRTLVADAERSVSRGPAGASRRDAGRELAGPDALRYMRDVLDRLAAG